jgi:SOS-response transcriptional repressor LexA/DNA-binding XRE family transcriptional regulator
VSLADRVRQVRTELRLNQRDFARLLGVIQAAVSHLESGRNQTPSGTTIELLESRFGVRRPWLVKGDGEPWSLGWRKRAETFGRSVAAFRKIKKRDIEELAEKLKLDPLDLRLVEEGRLLPPPDLLDALEEELRVAPGAIERFAEGVTRDSEAPAAPSKPALLRLVGTIAAGRPIEALEEHDVLDFDTDVLGARRDVVYALRVRGNSMVEDGIHDGDIVVVEPGREPRNGEIVVALVDGEATLKRLHRRTEKKVWLVAADGETLPVEVDARRLEVRGVAIALLRNWRRRRKPR